VCEAAAVGDEAEKGARPAADIEHAPAGVEPDVAERLLVGRALLVLVECPLLGSGAPERDYVRFGNKTWQICRYFTVATGLEPASSGVTGRFEAGDVNDDRCVIVLLMRA